MAKVTIDVDLGELEKDWEAVAWRVPRSGEFFINRSEHVQQCDEVELKYSRIIVRRKFVWPSWCKAAAICKDKDGMWCAYSPMPIRCDRREEWRLADDNADGVQYMCLTGHEWFVDLQLPENHDWTVPLLNPNYKAGGDE